MQGVIVLMFSQVIIKIVGLIYKVYLTNKSGFGDRGNAVYGGAFQIYAIFLTISSIGVPNAISKLVSAKVAIGDNKGAYRTFKIAFAVFGIVGFLGSCILFWGADYIANRYLQMPETETAILALAPSVFFTSVASVLKGFFNGIEKISVTANSQSIDQIFKTAFTIILVEQIAKISFNNTILMVGGATLATTFATLFSLVYLYRYFVKNKKEIWKEVYLSNKNKKDSALIIIKNILWTSIPIALCTLFSVLTKTIDAVTVVRILSGFIGEEEATLQYGILNGKVDTLITLPFSFNIAFATALIPAISGAIAKKQIDNAKKRIKLSLLITILIGLPCTMYMSLFAKEILFFLFPNATSGSEMLRVAAWSIIFVVLIQTINGALQGLGKVNTPVMAFGIGAIIKLLFNVLLIPRMGVNGAIISSLVSHFSSFIICFITLKKELDILFGIVKFFIKPLVATCIMIGSSYYIYINICLFVPFKISLIISLSLGLIIYIITIFLLKILSKEEMFMIPYGKKVYEMFEIKKRKNQ